MNDEQRDSPVSTGAVATVLAVELSRLSDLSEWEPVAQRAEAVVTALRGGEGVTPGFVANLRNAARKWRMFSPRLRKFYADVAPRSDTASRVLYTILFTAKPRRSVWHGPTVGIMRELWEETYGTTPTMTLYPNMESNTK